MTARDVIGLALIGLGSGWTLLSIGLIRRRWSAPWSSLVIPCWCIAILLLVGSNVVPALQREMAAAALGSFAACALAGFLHYREADRKTRRYEAFFASQGTPREVIRQEIVLDQDLLFAIANTVDRISEEIKELTAELAKDNDKDRPE